MLAACSASEEAGAPPATPDEDQAVADAQAMIPVDEIPRGSDTPAATEEPTR